MSLSIPGKTLFQTWRDHDLFSGLSVFLVAIPLCLGLAVASGAPAQAGLLAGIIGGLVVASLSRSALAISGPEAGLVALTAAGIMTLGSFESFLLAVIAAGLIQISLGVFKVGPWIHYVPISVMKGMISGLGLILIGKQIPAALGTSVSLQDLTQSSISIPVTLLSLGCFTLYLLLKRKSSAPLKIPLSLWVVIIGSLLTTTLTTYSWISAEAVTRIQIPSNIFSDFKIPHWSRLLELQIWKVGIPLGLLASLQALLCVKAIDKRDVLNRETPLNRELIAQGIGNVFCGLLGAIPLTAVIVRSSVNVDAGARTRLSFYTEGCLLLLAVLIFPWVLNCIPLFTLAVVLIFTGYNLTLPSIYRDLWREGWRTFVPFLLTVLGVLSFGLLYGVLIGIIFAFMIQGKLTPSS